MKKISLILVLAAFAGCSSPVVTPPHSVTFHWDAPIPGQGVTKINIYERIGAETYHLVTSATLPADSAKLSSVTPGQHIYAAAFQNAEGESPALSEEVRIVIPSS